MTVITGDLLRKLSPSFTNADKFADAMNELFSKYGINTDERISMFLAQLLHETGGGKWWKEIWGPTDAQKRYEGRKDLGNTVAGDGKLYMGRGGFQLTGRANYMAYKAYSGSDVVSHPELVCDPFHAINSSLWYWKKNGLNAYADASDVKGCTKRINGGYNGLADREAWYTKVNHLI